MRNIMKLFKAFSIFIVITYLSTISIRAEEEFLGIYIGEDISNSEPVLCQNDIETALPEEIENALGEKEYRVRITFNEKGKQILEDVTSENIGECMPIVYNNKIICKPFVYDVCADGETIICGIASCEEAEHLASILRTGADVRDKNSDGSNNAVSAYQGIFMNGDIFISLPLYTSYEMEGAIGIVYRVTKPVGDENGCIESDIIETLGEIYDLGSGEYEVRGEGIKYGLSYYDGQIALTGDSGYGGTYVQVSNSGANMNSSDIWLDLERNNTNDGKNVETENDGNKTKTIMGTWKQ